MIHPHATLNHQPLERHTPPRHKAHRKITHELHRKLLSLHAPRRRLGRIKVDQHLARTTWSTRALVQNPHVLAARQEIHAALRFAEHGVDDSVLGDPVLHGDAEDVEFCEEAVFFVVVRVVGDEREARDAVEVEELGVEVEGVGIGGREVDGLGFWVLCDEALDVGRA
jgi:hypothetical protein